MVIYQALMMVNTAGAIFRFFSFSVNVHKVVAE